MIKAALSITLLASLTVVQTLAQSLPHENLRWGLKNNGQAVQIDLNPLQAYRIQGLAGEDIGLRGLPKASATQKIKVAVLDTGIDYSHPELAPLIYKNKEQCATYEKFLKCLIEKGDAGQGECRDQILQADANVYPGACRGWSVIDGDIAPTPNNIIGRPDFNDTIGHGTHVAGIIASVTRNIELIPVQVISDAPNQPIKPFSIDLSPSEDVRNGFSDPTNLSERVARGIIYAMEAGAQVINLSLGWPEAQDSDIMKEAIAEANRRGIIIVAAAGNDSTTALLRPCQYKGVICVGAHRPDGAVSSFSNYGYAVDIAAPGSEILSAIPMDRRSVRLPGYKGYDYLSGTSQAAPYVAGAVAEMLSRGLTPEEIYPRLILGARPVKAEKAVIEGPANSAGQKVATAKGYKKNFLSGLLDIASALKVKEQALILPADKEVATIAWDRKSHDLQFTTKLKNYWSSVSGAVTVDVESTEKDLIYPEVTDVQILEGLDAWETQEEKTVQISLRIRDQQDAYRSRLPSELSYKITVKVDGQIHRQFEVQAEVIVGVVTTMEDPEIKKIPIIGKLPRSVSLSLFDEVYDDQQAARDYLMIGADGQNKKSLLLGLNQYTKQGYQMGTPQAYKFDGDFSLAVLQQKIRVDLDADGRSEYVIRFLEYPDMESKVFRMGEYTDHFFIFDSTMKLKKYVKYNDQRVLIPFKFQWMKIGNVLRPAWIGKGQQVVKKFDVTDLWGRQDDTPVKTPVDIFFYYLDQDFKLAQVTTEKDLRIADLLQSDLKYVKSGVVSVLVSKNLGTELKPSYVNDFFVGQVSQGQLKLVKQLSAVKSGLNYRNLVDTFKDNTLNLNVSANEFRGTMWYGLDAHQQQRVTLIDYNQAQIFDKLISSQKPVFDAALMVRSGYQSRSRAGIFLITNSEMEFHDIRNSKIATRSLERYSFYGEAAFIELQFPITVVDSQQAKEKLPALFKTEGSGLNKGHKIMTPIFDKSGVKKQIISPAKLRLKTEPGCRALEAPVYLGDEGGYAMDYYCGDQIMRIQLNY